MSTSSIPAYIDALLAALRARPALKASDVVISDGFPARDLSGIRLLSIGGRAEPSAQGQQMTAQLGAMRREEDYTVQVACATLIGGEDQKAARDAVFALMAEVEAELRTNPTLSGVVRESYVEGGITLMQTTKDEASSGRWAEVVFDVHVRNRI